MELLLISEKKIKINLSKTDLQHYGLTFSTLDYSNSETRTALKILLDKARKETGFSAENSKIFVQIYPKSHGGCEIYVSKTDKFTSIFSNSQENHDEKSEIYIFKNIENLIKVCKVMDKSGFKSKTSLYFGDDGNFYFEKEISETSEYFDGILWENSDGVKDNFKFYIGEHCKILCKDNAVSVISKI